jgi:hypothetical protein
MTSKPEIALVRLKKGTYLAKLAPQLLHQDLALVGYETATASPYYVVEFPGHIPRLALFEELTPKDRYSKAVVNAMKTIGEK